MADLFVSYSRVDKPRAAEIVRLLEDHGWDVFWDQEMRAGTLWPKVLEDELNSARCLVALWTTASIASRWVRIEAYEALRTDKLLPVLLDDVRPPLEFRQTQMFDLVGWNGDRADPRLAQLLADLTALLNAPVSQGGAQRQAMLAVPATLQRHMAPATLPNASGAEVDADPRDAQSAAGVSSTPKVRRADASWQRAAATIGASRTLMLAVGVAAVGTLAWWIGSADRSSQPIISATPSPVPQISVVKPSDSPSPQSQPAAPADPLPVKSTTLAAGPALVPPASRPISRQTPKLRSSRCLAIEEKFQQTGQIAATERDFLRSKECQ